MVSIVRNYINGDWSNTEQNFEALNPSDSSVVAVVAQSTVEDVDRAVAAARTAFENWRFVNPTIRAGYLHRIGDIVFERQDALALAITLEMGKTLGEATNEVQKVATAFHYYAEEATRVLGRIVPNDVDGFESLVHHEPIGVVGAITPWNYPLELIGWKLCAAVAAGCTIVIKPSEFSTSSAALLFQCINDAGLPSGVANLVFGRTIVGPAIVAHPDIDKIAFTGSTMTGNAIARSVPRAKQLTMELGGTCPMVVTAQADLPAAIAGAARRGFRNAGQICIAINRIYVERSVYDEFVRGLTAAVSQLVVGNGLDSTSDIGAMATSAGIEKVEQHIADAIARGATLTTGGSRITSAGSGNFMQGSVLSDCTPEMLIMSEETFGPVVGVMAFDGLDEGIALANSTDSGLAAYVYTQDLREVFELSRRLDFGNVAVNNPDPGIMNAPYGGRRGSGFGSEHGAEGMHGYLQYKHVRIRHGAGSK